MPVMMAVSTELTDFYVIFTRQNSIFDLPSTSKCPLIFEAFIADDKLLIGNGHGDTGE